MIDLKELGYYLYMESMENKEEEKEEEDKDKEINPNSESYKEILTPTQSTK